MDISFPKDILVCMDILDVWNNVISIWIYPYGYSAKNSRFCQLLEKMPRIYSWIYTFFIGYVSKFSDIYVYTSTSITGNMYLL